jgi:REP element-mobilizing transposase RayT
MGRRKRSYLPGAAFHLTARTSGHEHWWADDKLRNSVVGIVSDALHRTDARLVAFTIMTNHFHLTVRQGIDPLARLMHPVCQRIALLVRRAHGREGHIFERQFRDKPCASADHLRQVIYYTHRNPVKAGMCAEANEYVWSSACAYTGVQSPATDDEVIRPV